MLIFDKLNTFQEVHLLTCYPKNIEWENENVQQEPYCQTVAKGITKACKDNIQFSTEFKRD